MTKEEFIQLCDKEGYEIPPSFLNKEIWTEHPPLMRKPGEELAKLWAEAEEARKLYEKAMADVLTAQKEYILKLETYNTKKIELTGKEV